MMRTGAALTAVSAVMASASPASPVKKVISLLQELKEKVSKDLKNEETDMAAYTSFCNDEVKEKGFAITSASREIEMLEATIEDSDGSIQKFAAEIDTDSKESAAKSSELQDATDIRTSESKDFVAAQKELVDTVDTLSRAIVILKREMSFLQGGTDVKAADKASFADLTNALSVIVDAAFLDVSGRQKVKSFMETQMDEELTLKQMPEGPQAKEVAYENHSSGIVETLEELKDKAEASLGDLRKDEMTAKHNFQMLAQSLTDTVKVLDTGVAEAKSAQSEASEVLGKARGDLAEQQSVKKADEEYVSTLKTECANKASGWEERQTTAAGEIEAIAKGIEILTGKFGEGSFLQLSSAESGPDDSVRDHVATLMKKLGRKFNSFGMMQIAQAATADPFGKVRGLIESMIAKLETQAQEEATHDSFCKEETKKSEKSRELKSAESDKYRSRIDQANAAMATLKSEISELQQELTEIAKATATATEIRNKEKADYEVASTEYRESATAVTQALAVLKEFYNQAPAFVQVSEKVVAPAPEFGAAKSDASSMILGILETSASDFTKLLAEAEASESEAADSYKRLIQDNKVAKASKEAAVKGKTTNLKSLEVQLSHHQENLDTVSKELDAVLSYLEKLKPQCTAKAMTYEEKKAARESEMEGLKEALQILEGETAFVQKRSFLKSVRAHRS